MSKTEPLLLCSAIIKQNLINVSKQERDKVQVKLSFHGASSHNIYLKFPQVKLKNK
jgi:hypothetical protein